MNCLTYFQKNLFSTYLAFCRKSASTVTFDKNDPSPNLKGITTIQHKKYTMFCEFREQRRILTRQAFYQLLKTRLVLVFVTYQKCKLHRYATMVKLELSACILMGQIKKNIKLIHIYNIRETCKIFRLSVNSSNKLTIDKTVQLHTSPFSLKHKIIQFFSISCINYCY